MEESCKADKKVGLLPALVLAIVSIAVLLLLFTPQANGESGSQPAAEAQSAAATDSEAAPAAPLETVKPKKKTAKAKKPKPPVVKTRVASNGKRTLLSIGKDGKLIYSAPKDTVVIYLVNKLKEVENKKAFLELQVEDFLDRLGITRSALKSCKAKVR